MRGQIETDENQQIDGVHFMLPNRVNSRLRRFVAEAMLGAAI